MTTIQTYEELIEFIRGCHNPALAKKDGHVTQIWEDGEITFQKSGELLWMRNIHSRREGIRGLKLPMPVNYRDGSHSYAFVSDEDAVRIGRAIIEIIKRYNGSDMIDVKPFHVEIYELGIKYEAESCGMNVPQSAGAA